MSSYQCLVDDVGLQSPNYIKIIVIYHLSEHLCPLGIHTCFPEFVRSLKATARLTLTNPFLTTSNTFCFDIFLNPLMYWISFELIYMGFSIEKIENFYFFKLLSQQQDSKAFMQSFFTEHEFNKNGITFLFHATHSSNC